MGWKKIFLMLGCLSSLSLFEAAVVSDVHAAPPAAAKKAVRKLDVSKLKFVLTTNKNPISYKVGEEIEFRITLDYGQELPEPMAFFVQWTRSGDDGMTYSGMSPIAPGKDVTVKTSLDRAGFVRFQGRLTDLNGKQFVYFRNGEIREVLAFDAGAGCNVDQILPAVVEPADFDQFWEGVHAELAKVPVKAAIRQIPDDQLPEEFQGGKFLLQQVSVDCAGPRPVTGYLIQPLPVREKSLPVQISFDGYGQGPQGRLPDPWQYHAAKDRILFRINAHGYDLGKDAGYYKDFFKDLQAYAFDIKENEKPETSYFRGMAMRVIRAFDFVKTLPAWNGKDLIAQGGSQGGLQTAWAGSQVKGLTQCKPHVTWCSDIGGPLIGRQGGWMPDYRPGLAYYDTVFHARRIPESCELNITRIGLGDYVCPPTGVAAQYNAANCPKKALWIQNSTHMYVPGEPERILVSHSAGNGLSAGTAENRRDPLPSVDFVKAEFDENAWRLILPDGSIAEDFTFSGRENIRQKWNLKVMDKIYLCGVLNAEEDGFAVVGTGADWWWHFQILKTPGLWQSLFGSKDAVWQNIYGRSRGMPGGNGKASFMADDWIFRVPVKKGKNPIRLEVVLGEGGHVAVDTFFRDAAAREIDRTVLQQYKEFLEKYPDPLSGEETELSHSFFNPYTFTFKTSQAYPAALEYCIDGEKNWTAVWDPTFSKSHKVQLPEQQLKGKKVQLRIAQHIYLGGWDVLRSKPLKTVIFH